MRTSGQCMQVLMQQRTYGHWGAPFWCSKAHSRVLLASGLEVRLVLDASEAVKATADVVRTDW